MKLEEVRPWVIRVNRAAYKKRHKLLCDGRFYIIIVPFVLIGLGGMFFDLRMFLLIGFAALIWFVAVLLFKYDPFALDKLFIDLNSPRGGPAVRKKP